MSRLLPALCFLVCFAVYAWCAVPSLYWLDSSEFATASFTLGIAHPPGHPLTALWGRAFVFLPLGSIGLRVALSQAAAGALAVLALMILTRDLAIRMGLAELAASLLGSAAAFTYAFTWSHAIQSVRPEVYALQVATTLGACAIALRGTGSRRLGVAALLLGAGLANHHLLGMLGALPVAALALVSRPSLRRVTLALCAALAGLGLYLYLPLRAVAAPLLAWGDPRDLSRFLWVVSARAFARSVHRGSAAPVPFEAMRELTPIVVLCALAGLYLLLRRKETRGSGLFIGAQIALFASVAGLIAFDPANPDSHGYLSVGLAFLCVAAAALCAQIAITIAARTPRVAPTFAAALALLMPLSQLWRNGPRFALGEAYGAERFADFALADAPPRAAITLSHFQTVFSLFYLRALEGVRPDLVLQPRLVGYGARPAPARAISLLEYEPQTSREVARSLSPLGLFYRAGAPATPADFLAQDAKWQALSAGIARESADPQTRNALVWTFYLGAHLRCAVGQGELGASALERAALLIRTLSDEAPESPEIAELRRLCERS